MANLRAQPSPIPEEAPVMSTVFFSISYEDFNVTDCKVRTYLRVSVNYPQFITHDPVLGYSIFLFPSISFHFFCEFFGGVL